MTKELPIDLRKPYEREKYIQFFQHHFLPDDFKAADEIIHINFQSQKINKATKIGEVRSLELNVYEIEHPYENDPRVSLSKDAFRLLADYGRSRALIIFKSTNSKNFRLSLVTIDLKWEQGNRPSKEYSNPRRYSFFLGPDAKTHTPYEYLVQKGRVKNFEDLKNRFSIEVVNKEFYDKISVAFTNLTGGSRKIGSKSIDAGSGLLQLPDTTDDTIRKEFAVRLIGRLVFCWFLKKKRSEKNNIPLLPEEILSKDAVEKHKNYYHTILEPLFFEILNTPMEDRQKQFKTEQWKTIPFLNGGLFAPHIGPRGDFYEPINHSDHSEESQSRSHSEAKPKNPVFVESEKSKQDTLRSNQGVQVPDKWLEQLFDVFETYNFTIDENTSVDVELSIEPEMLGRIFENLLAEINPETGETARKSTGSYYTPRPIVEYMVDESLKQYLKTKLSSITHSKRKEESKNEMLRGTQHDSQSHSDATRKNPVFIESENSAVLDNKLSQLLSYNYTEADLTTAEKSAIIDALDSIKIIDPACGSGAFPMGILQKILLVLQKIDQKAEIWLKKKIEKTTDPDVKVLLESRRDSEQYNYIRKLGIIRDAIYGVDIQPIAVEISKLRFFLSLIVEEKVNDNKTENRGIVPLPNLETKFVAANTLVGLEKLSDELFDSDVNIIVKELFKVREDYFYANSLMEKQKLKIKDEKLKKNLLESIQESSRKINKEKIQKLKIEIGKLNKELGSIVNQPDEIQIIEISNLFGEKEIKKINRTAENKHEINSRIFRCKCELDKLENRRKGPIIKIAQKIADFNPYDQNKSNSWFDPEWMFGINHGFDIVIANPPYVQLQKDSGKLADIYKDCGYKTFERTGDIYSLFYEKGIELLKNNGHLCFITSNKWMRTGYGETLRKYFLTKDPVSLIDLGPGIFESATVDTNILIIRNAANSHSLRGITLTADAKEKDLSEFVNDNAVALPKIGNGAWFIGSSAEQKLKEKIERLGKPLKDWDVNIYRGVLTGLNEAFIIDTPTKELLCSEDPKSAEILKPILRGRDIKRYSYEWAGLWLIASGFDIDVPKLYPAIYKYLKQFEKIAKKRDDQGKNWWNLRSCAYYPEFEKEKIVWKALSLEPAFCYIEKIMLTNDKANIMTSNNKDLKYLYGYFNSKIFQFLFSQIGINMGRGFEYKIQFMNKIPIPQITTKNCTKIEQIEKLVEKIIQVKKDKGNSTEIEHQIDQMVYALYGLTEEEIVIVEQSGEK